MSNGAIRWHDGRLVMVRPGNWKHSACLDPDPHDVTLHNLEDDPFERTDLANAAECQDKRNELLRLIEEIDTAQSADADDEPN